MKNPSRTTLAIAGLGIYFLSVALIAGGALLFGGLV